MRHSFECQMCFQTVFTHQHGPHPLKIPNGAALKIHGPWPSPRILLVLSRDDNTRDKSLLDRVVSYFVAHHFTVIQHEPELAQIWRTLARFAHWPRWARGLVKFFLLASHPRRWPYFFQKFRTKTTTVEFRLKQLKAVVRHLGPDREISIWSRSSGGRVASLLAREVKLHRIICLGYPFQHPEKPAEPERYLHLSDLQTPFLIIQGTRDPYGGSETSTQYHLSPTTRLEFVNTDHNFDLPEPEWNRLLPRIRDFLA